MKTLNEIISIIKDLKKEIEQKYKVEILGIFGSFARGEQKETSDVDILVKFHKNATLFDFIGLSIFLQEKLGIDVDIVPQDAVRKELREKINQEVVNI
ncbi:DNA polymerase [Thermosipho melanesiensis]|uniref:DNA polymerase, beta domain protein region n=2 Tax=Thermosipho melanesiensis TaxID=46541 RepID=A6LNN4_THEM4|nr:nucleotidyltransferase [Thermosipho melanesiensis]ABR31535.1 DNA polymerase, beta domain protein region [Thermosipho melanesiensis BI429]APT74574.1 DNA polymerase [Thermosipho melanesiensis]OOC35279.1 DNA polymerase [Thermosipho melanesiensis]OOC35498.1 DNA polymerase [Thermosipho melanesiensis]OOC36534.1 DNA polymerase [Thermosipho melanesiensis]